MPFDIKDGITLSIAAVGAVLGIINTLHSLNQRRVKLRVIPKYAQYQSDGILQSAMPIGREGPLAKEQGCIEVVNLSAFAVNIGEVGFTVEGDPRKHPRMVIGQPVTLDGKPFHRRLESRNSITGYFDLKTVTGKVRKAYTITDCGEVAYGTSPALKEMVRRATKA
jgi:hypothetical protein